MLNLETIENVTPQPETVEPAVAQKDWTVMIYLAGNNNLSENMAYSLESLGRLAASLSDEERSRINILAFFEGSSLTAPPMLLDFSEVRQGTPPLRQPMTATLQIHRTSEGPAHNAEEPGDALLNFIRWCTADENGRGRRARNYALILSGHSLGFHGTTFLRGEGSEQYFTLGSMRRALETANELYLRNDADGRLAVLGFDSCVMSMVEVGYEFKDVARTLIASEGSLPNSGWGYAPMLSSLVAALSTKGDDALTRSEEGNKEHIRETARSFVRSFADFYKDLAIGGCSIDIAAWNLDRVEPLAARVDRLGQALDSILSDPNGPAFRDLKKIVLQSHYDSQTYMADQYLDIKDFCGRLIEECGHLAESPVGEALDHIPQICRDVIAGVDDCVLECGFSGDAYQFSNGISIYFPWSHVALALTDRRYRELRFVNGDDESRPFPPRGVGLNWYSFLRGYTMNVTLRKARNSPKNIAANAGTYGSINRIQNAGFENLPAFSNSGPAASIGSTRDVPPIYKGINGIDNYMIHFRRFKNVELGWDISGYAGDADE